MLKQSLQQQTAIRIFIVGNTLLSGFSIPIPIHILITVICSCFITTKTRYDLLHSQLIFLLLIMYGIFVYFLGPCVDGMMKVIQSAIMLPITFIALCRLCQAVRLDRMLVSLNEALIVLSIIVTASFIEYIVLLSIGQSSSTLRVGGLFTEPSHLALSATPLIIYVLCLGDFNKRLLTLLITACLLTISYSSTLVVLILTIAPIVLLNSILKARLSRLMLGSYILYVALFLSYLFFSDYESTWLRISDVFDLRPDSNLSSLVYANGWETLISNLIQSNGFGLGLNAMGCNPRIETEISSWLFALEMENQNFNDGSFIVSKIGSEFGVVGLMIFVMVTWFSIKCLMYAKNASENYLLLLSASWLAVVTLGGALRSGGGYFSGSFLLGVFAYLLLVRHQFSIVFKRTKL